MVLLFNIYFNYALCIATDPVTIRVAILVRWWMRSTHSTYVCSGVITAKWKDEADFWDVEAENGNNEGEEGEEDEESDLEQGEDGSEEESAETELLPRSDRVC